MSKRGKEAAWFPNTHFALGLYRTIILMILLAFASLSMIISMSMNKQNALGALSYNKAAVQGIADFIQAQKESFLSMLNDEYYIYFAYKDGLFTLIHDNQSDTYPKRESIYRFLASGFLTNSAMTSFVLYTGLDNRIYSVTSHLRKGYQEEIDAFADLIEVYRNPLTKLAMRPSALWRLLDSRRSYSLLYCIRDADTKRNIGALQADYSVQTAESYINSHYPNVLGEFIMTDLNGVVLFATDTALYDETFPWMEEIYEILPLSDAKVNLGGKLYYVNNIFARNPDIAIFSVIDVDILNAVARHNAVLLACVTAALVGFICLSIFFYKTQYDPIVANTQCNACGQAWRLI
ncbi:hypothetical protein FACS1894184_13470 [Clostridia bacterium]|nr:hypothetical protein FACS1894184_13470 [Clostridia bacterium]